jgi:hypothetical protein
MINNYDGLKHEIDMLKGNINRMCVALEKKELDSLYLFANLRLKDVYAYNLYRIKEGEK